MRPATRIAFRSFLPLCLALVLVTISPGIGGFNPGVTAADSPSYKIHTVQWGESLWRISRLEGTTITRIQELNQLPDPNRLVPGMNLLVPRALSGTYVVQPGDTLWLTSRKLGVSLSTLITRNQLSNPDLIYPGQRLIYPTTAPPALRPGRINAYVMPRGEADRQLLERHADYLSQVSLFSVPVQPDGSLGVLRDSAAFDAAVQGGVDPILVITNFQGPTFDPELARQLLDDAEIRARLIEAVMERLRARPYVGLDVDFENLYPEDRQLYTDFITELGAKVRGAGYTFSIAMAPKAADRPNDAWVGFFDYAALAPLVDYFVLMTYEWGWIGSRPMAIAPINQVRRVLEYATSLIPPEKILMGVPLYGYDWELPDTPQNMATQIGPHAAMALAANKGVVIRWDDPSQSPYFRYWNDQGAEHEIWFEDAKSVMAKYHLAREFGVRGISYWVLGDPFPANWPVLKDYFQVQKSRTQGR